METKRDDGGEPAVTVTPEMDILEKYFNASRSRFYFE